MVNPAYAHTLIIITFAVVGGSILYVAYSSYQDTTLEESEQETELVFDSDPDIDWTWSEDELYIEEKEQSESGLARKPDGAFTEEKLQELRWSWSENDMRRMELNRNKPDKYEQFVINEFETGNMKHIKTCEQLNSYYLLYYGQIYGNQYDFSNNKQITDYLKERMWAIDCEFKEQSELKEKIDAEKQRVDEATEKVMKELEEVYKEN